MLQPDVEKLQSSVCLPIRTISRGVESPALYGVYSVYYFIRDDDNKDLVLPV